MLDTIDIMVFNKLLKRKEKQFFLCKIKNLTIFYLNNFQYEHLWLFCTYQVYGQFQTKYYGACPMSLWKLHQYFWFENVSNPAPACCKKFSSHKPRKWNQNVLNQVHCTVIEGHCTEHTYWASHTKPQHILSFLLNGYKCSGGKPIKKSLKVESCMVRTLLALLKLF